AELTELAFAARACERAHESEDPDGYYHHNEDFHRIIYRASGNSFLTAEAGRLQKRLRPFRRMQLRIRGRMLQSLGEHSVILQALTDGDPVLAAETLRNHVLIQGERFHDLLSSYEKSPAGNRV